MTFHKRDIAKELSENEKRKFSNFLQRMKVLNVPRSGDARGEYQFVMRMVWLYIYLKETAQEGRLLR